MRRALGVIIGLTPFVLTLMGPVAEYLTNGGLSDWFAQMSFLRMLAFGGLVLGGGIAIINAYLSFVRPAVYRLRHGETESYRFISGVPIIGSVILMFSPLPLCASLWPSFVAMVLLALDTAGPMWFVIATWGDDSLWKGQ